MPVGYKRKRIGAFITAASNGWKVGDTLTSSTWKHVRRVLAVEPAGVEMVGGSGRGFCATFPPDVTRIRMMAEGDGVTYLSDGNNSTAAGAAALQDALCGVFREGAGNED